MSYLRLIAVLIFAIAISACSGPDNVGGSDAPSSPTPVAPSSSAGPSTSSAPSTEASATPPTTDASPTPAGPPSERFAFNQLLEVTTDGLAVRRGPTTSAELAFGAPWDPNTGDWVGTTQAVRLAAGYQVLVLLGPVTRDGFDWYEVRNVEGPGTEAEVVQWDTNGDGSYADSGWIAVGDGSATFVEPVAASDGAPSPLVFAAGSSGTFLSDPFEASGDIGGTWVLVTDELAPCDFTVTLEPSGEQLAAASLIGVYEYGSLGSTGLAAGEYRLRVIAGVESHPDAACNWSLALFQHVS